jgi:hypothetical protein
MQAVHRTKTLGRRRSHHLTTRTPAALSQGTNQARRGSRKRPDPPGCEAQGGPGLAMTAQSVSVHHDRDDPSKKAAFEPVKLQLWLAIAAYPPGRLYRAVSPDENLNAALRRAMAARDQARWLPHHRPQGRRPSAALQPSWQ